MALEQWSSRCKNIRLVSFANTRMLNSNYLTVQPPMPRITDQLRLGTVLRLNSLTEDSVHNARDCGRSAEELLKVWVSLKFKNP